MGLLFHSSQTIPSAPAGIDSTAPDHFMSPNPWTSALCAFVPSASTDDVAHNTTRLHPPLTLPPDDLDPISSFSQPQVEADNDEDDDDDLDPPAKRPRHRTDVDGEATAAAHKKKRRLRLGALVTSRLSRPYAVPPTFCVDRGSSRIAVWAQVTRRGGGAYRGGSGGIGGGGGVESRALLRKAAILNRARRRAGAVEKAVSPNHFSQRSIMAPPPLPHPCPLGPSNYDALDMDDDEFNAHHQHSDHDDDPSYPHDERELPTPLTHVSGDAGINDTPRISPGLPTAVDLLLCHPAAEDVVEDHGFIESFGAFVGPAGPLDGAAELRQSANGPPGPLAVSGVGGTARAHGAEGVVSGVEANRKALAARWLR